MQGGQQLPEEVIVIIWVILVVPPGVRSTGFFLDHDYSKKVKFWETLKVISVIRYGKESLNKPLKNIVNMISFFMSPLQHCTMDKWLLKRVEL